MKKNILKLISILSLNERKKGLIIILISFLMALIDSLSASSFMSFMSLINNKNYLNENKFLYYIKNYLGVKSDFDFIYIFGICVTCVIVAAILLKALNTYAQLRYIHTLEYTVARRLINLYLKQPYEWFLNKNSSEVGKTILNEIAELSRVSINSIMTLISSSLIIICMLTMILIVNYTVALTIIIIFLTTYCLIFLATRLLVVQIGSNRFSSNAERFLAINELFGAIKEIKISGQEKIYLNKFSAPAAQYSKSYTNARLIGQLPRFGLEIVAFIGILSSLLLIYRTYGGIVDSLPYISLYLYAGFRILPSLQVVFSSITQLRVYKLTTESIFKDFNELKVKKHVHSNEKIIIPKKRIKLSNINFKYFESNEFALQDISVEFIAGESTAIIGSTGSGKSTLIDIIIGLLNQQKGNIFIDNLEINESNKNNWQRSIGYVPQSIYLSDETIASNIAFGIDQDKINFNKLIEVSKISKIHSYIDKDLKNKYFSIIGERGVKLSGGQRQRIGIARALYKSPKVLVLDEATSALDTITEKQVMQGIYKLENKPTIIVIAHRLSTVRNCDKIIILKDGKINDIGVYEELSIRNKIFREMIKGNN